ncbi:hypothetical protein K2X33_04985, partial [bacterium]|nr:hypothetical protein [bacterium]
MRYVCVQTRLASAIVTLLFSSFAYGEFGTPLRPPSFSGNVVYRAVASQPSNTTNYLSVGRAWTGSNYQGIISSNLVDGGWKDGSFTRGVTAWYPGQTFIDFSGAGFDNLCNAVTYAYDGYIVACRSMKANGYYDIYLAKVNSSGTFDASFGTNGIVATGLAGNSTDGHGFVRGIAYNSAVNVSNYGVVTVVGSTGKNATTYRPFAASFDQKTGAAWGSKVTINDYLGSAVGIIYDSTTSNAYYMAGTETVAPHSFYIHKFTYSNSSDTSLDEAASPWGDPIDFTVAGGGSESVPSGIALGSTGGWGVDIVAVGANKTSASSGNWRCATAALESSTGNLRLVYGKAAITGGVDDKGITLITHDATHDCILNSGTALGSGVMAVLGAAYTTANSNYDQLVIKLDADGNPVTGFGTSGFKLISAGPADDVNNSAVKIGSYLYTGGRVHNAGLYQGGDLQRIDITAGTPAPTVSSLSTSATATSGQTASITVTATYSDASTASVPLASMNLSTTDTSKITLGTSSAFALYGVTGSATIAATLSETISSNISLSIAAPTYVTTNIKGDWTGAYANQTGPFAAGASGTTWYDRTTNAYNGTKNSSTYAAWSGTGTYSSPYAVTFSGSGSVNFGTGPLASQTKMLFTSWIKPGNGTANANDAVV